MGVGGDRVGVLDVQGGLAGPAGVVGVLRVEGGNVAPLPDLDLGVLETPLLVEDLQVVLDGRRAEGVDDDDRAALAGDALLVQRRQVVGGLVLDGRVAVDADLADALGGGQRRRAGRGEVVAEGGRADVHAGEVVRGGGGRGADGRNGDGAGGEGGGPHGEQSQGAAEGGGAAHGTPWDAEGPTRSGRVGLDIPSSAA